MASSAQVTKEIYTCLGKTTPGVVSDCSWNSFGIAHWVIFFSFFTQILKFLHFVPIAEHLCYCFTDSRIHQVNMENGFDVSTRGNMRLLKRVLIFILFV